MIVPTRSDPARPSWLLPALIAWCVLALACLVPLALMLDAAVPILTVVWIVVPLVAVARSRDAGRVGFRPVPAGLLVRTTAIYLGVSFGLALLVEPWTHTYERLLELAMTNTPIDSTFAWLVRYPRLPGIAGMAVYSGAVTMFGEELFFRGWLLQTLRRRMGVVRAIVVQASLFAIPQLIAATFMSPPQALVYVVVFAWLSAGIAGGWAAARTNSIWPSLITVTLVNLVLVALLT